MKRHMKKSSKTHHLTGTGAVPIHDLITDDLDDPDYDENQTVLEMVKKKRGPKGPTGPRGPYGPRKNKKVPKVILRPKKAQIVYDENDYEDIEQNSDYLEEYPEYPEYPEPKAKTLSQYLKKVRRTMKPKLNIDKSQILHNGPTNSRVIMFNGNDYFEDEAEEQSEMIDQYPEVLVPDDNDMELDNNEIEEIDIECDPFSVIKEEPVC